MGRIMAIDYGGKRTGLAVTDPLRIIATALDTVETPTLLQYIKEYCQKEEVDVFVVGEAHRMDGSMSQSMELIEPFVERLKKEFPEKRVDRIDERFTSKIAFRAIVESGTKKKQRQEKGRVDRVAATVMLQDYMKMHP